MIFDSLFDLKIKLIAVYSFIKKRGMKNNLIFAIVLLCNFSLLAQNAASENLTTAETKDFGITVNYFNEVTQHLGIEIGMESSIFKSMVMSYQVGFYFVEKDQTDVSLYWEMGYHKSYNNGYHAELSVGIGYLTTYLPRQKNNEEKILEIVYMPSVTLGALGYDFRKTKNIPIRIFGDVMFFWKKPVGKSGENAVAIKVGATYYIK